MQIYVLIKLTKRRNSVKIITNLKGEIYMSYTKEDLEYFQVKDLKEAREKIVDVRLFDYIDDLKLRSDVERQMNFTKRIIYRIHRRHIKV